MPTFQEGLSSGVLRAFGFALLWWVVAEGRFDAWWLGATGIAAATWASMKLLPPGGNGIRVGALLAFLGYFVWHSARGGWQVALLAFRSHTALAPSILELRLDLPAGAPRLLMLNAMGLMPGTLGVHLDEATLRLHVLDAQQPIEDEARQLEARTARLFGVAP